MMAPQRVIDRVRESAVIRKGECLLSMYSPGSHQYPQIGWHDGGRRIVTLCHRVIWEAEHGPIPKGMTVDHICHERRCLNLAHLQLLTNEENGRANGHTLKTHCPRGHAYDDVNTYVNRYGHRICRSCARERRAA